MWPQVQERGLAGGEGTGFQCPGGVSVAFGPAQEAETVDSPARSRQLLLVAASSHKKHSHINQGPGTATGAVRGIRQLARGTKCNTEKAGTISGHSCCLSTWDRVWQVLGAMEAS